MSPRKSQETNDETEEEMELKKPNLVCSTRLMLAGVCGIALFNVAYVRVGLPMAIICMSKPTTEVQQQQHKSKNWEFNWSSSTVGLILSSVFYGFIIGPTISGYLCFKYGGQIILIIGTICSGVTYLMIPEGTRFSPIALCIIRVFTGLFASWCFPAFYDLMSHWTVPEERQLLMGGALWGIPLASILNFPINTSICEEFGWIWIFYSFAVWMVLCGFCFFFSAYDYPEKCPYISVKELNFLKQRIPKTKTIVIPWKKILTSMPLYAYIIMHFSMNYVYLSIIMSLPLLMEEVYHLTFHENGFLSAMPFIGALIMRIMLSLLFEPLRFKLNLSKNVLRKILVSVGAVIVSIFLMIPAFLPASAKYWALVCFVVATCSLELCITGGYLLSIVDLCPSYANVVSGLANSIANIAGLIGPVVIGSVTKNKTREEWNLVYYITISLLLAASLFYIIFGQNKTLSWGLKVTPSSPEVNALNAVNVPPSVTQ
ncbi:hypothetical protein RUM44_010587 [Polyplax serrata]|uniref:Major facilitator superfamily (MFS) profile domain-containing protein n=1 Tax=Polyplax serrata TaxID=468196 RepID=A0ABR1AVX7_POLSC